MPTRFLKTYSDDEQNDNLYLLQEAQENFPFSIVKPLDNYVECLERKNYHAAHRCILDFYEMSFQYISGYVISQLNHQQVAWDAELREMFASIVGKPLSTGDWINDIFLTLIKKSKDLLPDNALVQDIHKSLFSPDPVHSGWPRNVDELKQIVGIRNAQAHGTYQTDEIMIREISTIESGIWKFLSMFQSLGEYYFFTVEQINDEQDGAVSYTIALDKGTTSQKKLNLRTDIVLEENTYYVTSVKLRPRMTLDSASIVKLSPFIIYYNLSGGSTTEKCQYVFQSLKKQGDLNKMIYTSAHQEAERIETELFRERFLEILAVVFGDQLSHEGFRFNLSKTKSISEYTERANIQTNNFLTQQIDSKKFDEAVFINRLYLSKAYDDFLRSDYSAFIMLGDAGAGKTNQICHWASTLSVPYISIAFYSKIFTGRTLENQLQETFNESKKRKAVEILKALDAELTASNTYACIYFDAINECYHYNGSDNVSGPVMLLTEIDKLFLQNNLSRFKLIISCRSYT